MCLPCLPEPWCALHLTKWHEDLTPPSWPAGSWASPCLPPWHLTMKTPLLKMQKPLEDPCFLPTSGFILCFLFTGPLFPSCGEASQSYGNQGGHPQPRSFLMLRYGM